MSKNKEILLATLGTSAKVITLAIDALLKRRYDISEVVIFHNSDKEPHVKIALEQVKSQVEYYREKNVNLRFEPIIDKETNLVIYDVEKESDVKAVIDTLFGKLMKIKSLPPLHRYNRVHFSIAGGRKSMTGYALFAVMCFFEKGDKCWHLFSRGPIASPDNTELHAGAEDTVNVNEVPFIRLRDFSSDKFVFRISNPLDAQANQDKDIKHLRNLMRSVEQGKGGISQDKLSPSEIEVFRLMASEGLNKQQIADKLGYAVKTVENARTKIKNNYMRITGEEGIGFERIAARFSRVFMFEDE